MGTSPAASCGCFATGVDCWTDVSDVIATCHGDFGQMAEYAATMCERVSVATNSCTCSGAYGIGQGCDFDAHVCSDGVLSFYLHDLRSECTSTTQPVCEEGALLAEIGCEPRPEIGGNGVDDDGDGLVDESTTGGACTAEIPCNGIDDDRDGVVDNDTRARRGTQFWQRDRETPLCAPLCATDDDCAGGFGRCRVRDVLQDSRAAEILLVEDLSPEAVEAAMEAEVPELAPVMLCDPFWDIEGALDSLEWE